MSEKAKYILYTILDMCLTYGGTTAILVLNYIDKDTSLGYKLSLSGIVLVLLLVFFVKKQFESSYQEKVNTYLQQIATATDEDIKSDLAKELETYKVSKYIYNRIVMLLPFALAFVLTYLAVAWFEDLNTSLGVILISMGAGSVFNVLRQPVAEKAKMEKLKKKHRKE